MASRYQLVKSFASFKGLDLRSGDLLRAREFASSLNNVDFRSTAALNKRKGFQIKANDVGGAGLVTYHDLNPDTGQVTEKLCAVDTSLKIKTVDTLNLSYGGSGTAYYTIKANGSSIMLNLFEDDVVITSQNLGTGLETSPVTTSDLTATLDALTDFSCTLSGTGTIPAAFIEVKERGNVASSASLQFETYESVNSPSASPFALHWAERNSDTFEPASFVNNNGVLYISNGYDELHKYDGQNLYRAGMPRGEQPTASTVAAGAITNSNLQYKIVYYQKDAKGNIVEGEISEPSPGISASSNNVSVSINNIQSSTGFNTNCAIVDGTQSAVTTISVDDGSGGAHTLETGDTAYFFDTTSGAYVEREVTAVTASSITIAGAAVEVTDNRPISNNLRIDVYRNQSAGDTFYLVDSKPNDSFSSSQGFVDNAADSSLGGEYVEPIKQRGLPPKGRYITLYRGQLICGGFINNVDAVQYSDVDSPEYFPAGTNSFNVDTSEGDTVTGVKALNSVLYVFKDETIHTLTGDLINDNFRVDILTTGGVGCRSNASIAEVNGRLFFLDRDGVYAVTQGQDGVQEISELISPEFDNISTAFNYKRATATHWLEREKYVLALPVLETNGGENTAATTSKVYAYDIYRNGWLIWSNIKALGGFASEDGELYFSSRDYNTLTTSVDNKITRFLNTGTQVDYADHADAILATYKTHWEALGEPSMFKKFLRLKLHSLDAAVNDFETQLFKINVTTEKDYSDVPIFNFTYDFGNGATGGWGENQWGQFPWGDSRLSSIKTKLKSTKAQSLRVIFENGTVNENFLLSGYELEVAAPYMPAIKE